MNTVGIPTLVKAPLLNSLVVMLVIGLTYITFEPIIGHSQINDSFVVSQQMSDEISFLANPGDVTMMEGSNSYIEGLSGGYATGTTRVVIRSNDAQGYNMTLAFTNNATDHSMAASSTAWINDYTPASGGVPDFSWVDNGTGGAAEFGYTVSASTTSELDQSFLDNGTSACNQVGGSDTDDKCWLNATTSAETIINTSGPTVSSTTTIKFKVAVPANPSPSLPTGYYIATGTLTATNNP